jgi:acyl dehydratase
VVIDADRVRAYVAAVGDDNPAYAAGDPPHAAGRAGTPAIAPPTFAAVYALHPPGRAVGGWGIPPQRLVHGEQSFTWSRPVRVGETLTTSTRVADAYRKRNLQFMVAEATCRDQAGVVVCVSRATILVLPDPAAASSPEAAAAEAPA